MKNCEKFEPLENTFAQNLLNAMLDYLRLDAERGEVTVGVYDPRTGGLEPYAFGSIAALSEVLVLACDAELAGHGPRSEAPFDATELVWSALEKEGGTLFFQTVAQS